MAGITNTTVSKSSGLFNTLTVGGSNVSVEGHTYPMSDVINLSSVLNGVTSSSIEKDTVTADVGNFRLLSVSGSANFAVNNISANSVYVNGNEVAISGHHHTVSEINGLSNYAT